MGVETMTFLKRALAWIVASDPGLTRLGSALSAAFAMGSALGVEYGFARLNHLTGPAVIVAMLMGAVVAMQGSLALAATSRRTQVRRAVFFPVAMGLGMALGVLGSANVDLSLGLFVVVMFVAVAIRRFGIPFFFYGFMGWMGYFFASFTGARLAQLPGLVGAVVVATVWVLLLHVTILRSHPERALTRTLSAFRFRARAVLEAVRELLAEPAEERAGALQRVRTRITQVTEAALYVEGWSAEADALPDNWSAAALRQHLIDVEHLLDEVGRTAAALADVGGPLAASSRRAVDWFLEGDERLARETACDLCRWDGVHHVLAGEFGTALVELIDMGSDVRHRRQHGMPFREESGFEPMVTLFMGGLPGSPAVAQGIAARGHRWNPLARLAFPMRQAVQVAVSGGLAILAGRWISPERYYWAVIAAFIMSAGTATRSEAMLKGLNRVIGTLAGLVAAVGLAEVTAGHPALVVATVVVSMFLGIYWMRVAYATMTFFITIILGQLYSVLHEFSAGLMVLRLEETLVGAAAGIVVAALVVPLSTRDTIQSVRRNFLEDLAQLLETAAKRFLGHHTDADLDALVRRLEDRRRQLEQVANPVTPPLSWGFKSSMSHGVAICTALTAHARALDVHIRRENPGRWEAGARAAEVLGVWATSLARGQAQDFAEPSRDVWAPLFEPDADEVRMARALLRMGRLMPDVGLGSRGGL